MTNGRWRSSIAGLTALALALVALPAAASAPAAVASDGTLTDGFDSLGSPWTQVAGHWEASGGAAHVITAGTERGSILALTDHRMGEVSSATVTFSTDGGGESAWAGFTLDRGPLSDDYTESGYTVLLRNNGELAVIAAAGSSGVRYLDRVQTDARPGASPVTVTAQRSGDDLSVRLGDGAELLSVTDDAFSDGGFSLAAHRDLRMTVDTVSLTGVVEQEEPVVVPADCVTWSGTPASNTERGTVLNSDDRIDAVTRRVEAGTEPQASAFDRLEGEVVADLERTPAPPSTFFVPFFYNNPEAHRAARDGLQNDANAAYRLALAYRVSGDAAAGAHAVAFLDAWTETVECVRTSEDSALAFSYHFPAFVHAAELLRGSDVWSVEGEARFAGFVRETAIPVAESIMHRENNWGSWALETKAAGAAYLADEPMIAAVHERAIELLEHQLDENGHMPEEVGRNNGVGDYGIWYTHFSLLPLMLISETLDGHGYDLHEYVTTRGVGLSDAVEAVSGWVADPSTFPYYEGEISGLHNVRTIDYLRDAGVTAHSMSYFELAANHYPSARLDALIAEEGPMTTIHSAPFLSLTHGAMAAPDPRPLIETTVTARCVAGVTLITARAENVSDERVKVRASFDGRTSTDRRVVPGRSSVAVFVTTDDAGRVDFAATSAAGIRSESSSAFDVAPCTFPWRH